MNAGAGDADHLAAGGAERRAPRDHGQVRVAGPVTQWAAVTTLVGEISAPEQMKRPASKIATVKP